MISPKLSIITVNLNNALGLHKTIESIINQTFIDYEYIIIDGDSTDGSVELIKEYTNKIAYWVSEPDKGIYNAMNKGILKANGKYCLFLNSGDWLLNNNILNQVFDIVHTEDLICCKLFEHYKYQTSLLQLPKEKFTFYDFFTSTLSHPSTFIRKELFSKLGIYDENLIIASDWKFFIEAVVINKCSYKSLDIETTYFSPGGISSTLCNLNVKEREMVLMQLFLPYIDDYKILHRYKSSRVIKLWEKLKNNKIVLYFYNFLVH